MDAEELAEPHSTEAEPASERRDLESPVTKQPEPGDPETTATDQVECFIKQCNGCSNNNSIDNSNDDSNNSNNNTLHTED